MESTKKNLLVASDGSNRAQNAIKYSCDFFSRNHYFQKIIICSIMDPKKTYLPHQLQPAQLENNFKDQLLSRFSASKYEVIMRKKEVDAKTDVLKIAKDHNVGLLALGFNGRKSQLGGTTGGHSLLGSSVEHSMNFCTIPFLVCKIDYVQKKDYTFAVCLDGSQKAFHALTWLQQFVTPADKLICIYAPHFETEKFIRNTIKSTVEKQKRIYVELAPGKQPTTAIIEYINDDPTYQFDFVLIGNNGRRAETEHKSFIGHVAKQVLIDAISNVILYPQY